MSAAKKLTTTLSTKGQLILPKAIREQKQWRPGTRLVLEETPEGVLIRAAPLFAPTTVDRVFGCLKYNGPPKTLEEMDEGITAEVKARHARGRY